MARWKMTERAKSVQDLQILLLCSAGCVTLSMHLDCTHLVIGAELNIN